LSDLTQPADHAPAAIGVLTIVAIVAWTWAIPKRYSFLPAPLFGVVLGTVAAQIMKQFDARFAEINYIRVAGDLTVAFSLPTWEQAPLLIHGPILMAGVTVAFVASAESLLTATAADAMQQHAPRTKYGQELMAQGIGNMVCGFLGAIPVTGVIVRTGANIQAGAQTRLATILHGVWLLLFVTMLPWVLELIPIASLAAVLVYTGFKLMHPKPVKVLLEYGRSEVAIYLATMATVIVVDLLAGIVFGIVLALAKLLNTFSHLKVRLVTEDGRTILYLEGAATFVRLPMLAAELAKVPPSTELHVHFEGLSYIDHACLDLFMTWEKQHGATGGTLVMDWESLTARFRPHARPGDVPGSLNGELRLGGATPALPYKMRTILCPTDLSVHSDYAFQHAGALAKEHGAKLILAHVFPPSDATSETEASMVVSESEKQTIRKKLETMRPLDPRTTMEVRLAEGQAAQEILRLAKESEADLIVMGTHGRTGMSHLVLGSVAEEVARVARCPVIIVKSARDGSCSL
jgi:MFS superfamily sulfate permease-like transporter